MVQSGSRGPGQTILDRHRLRHNVAGLRAKDPDRDAFLAEHDAAVRWAVLNRTIIAERFCERLGTDGIRLLDIGHSNVTAHRDGWRHRKGAAPANKGLVVLPGSRGDMIYLVQPRVEQAGAALHPHVRGAGRKWRRSEARDKVSRRLRVADRERTRLGSRVICEDRDPIFAAAPPAIRMCVRACVI